MRAGRRCGQEGSENVSQAHDVEIRTDGSVAGTRLWIDGQEVLGIARVDFEHGVGLIPEVTVRQYPKKTQLEGKASVKFVTVCPRCKKDMRGPEVVETTPMGVDVAEFTTTEVPEEREA